MMLPAVYTVGEVAARLRVCRRKTVYDLLASGKLEGFRVGTHWRVTEAALVAFMRPATPIAAASPSFQPPADPRAFDRLIPKKRVFSGSRNSHH
jgi:excisionase family DNA binding protein